MRYIFIFIVFLLACRAAKQPERIEFTAADVYPEGIAYDSSADVFYVSSMRTATIGKVDRNGNYSVLHADSSLKSSYGMKMHPDGKHLYVLTGDANYSKYSSPDTYKKMSKLICIDVASGRRTKEIDLSALLPGKHFGNDLTFDSQGNIYVTDSYAHAIYKIDAGGRASVFAKDKKFETEGFGVNGLAYHPGNFLLVSNSNTGRIYKVDMKNPAQAQVVTVDQYFLGADGVLLNNSNELTVVVNGGINKIYLLRSTDDWKTATVAASTLASDLFAYPTTATFANNQAWVVNAKTNELLDSNSMPALKFTIQKAELKPLPGK